MNINTQYNPTFRAIRNPFNKPKQPFVRPQLSQWVESPVETKPNLFTRICETIDALSILLKRAKSKLTNFFEPPKEKETPPKSESNGFFSRFPWRFKSKYHEDFHTPMHFCRELSELQAKGATNEEMLNATYNIQTPEQRIFYGNLITQEIDDLERKDKSFNSVIPSLFSLRYYRGIDHVPENLKDLKEGDTFVDYGYGWFSPSKKYAEEHIAIIRILVKERTGVIIETVIPFGTKISRDIYDLSDLNPFRTMNIVVPRNSRYEVLQKEAIGNLTYIKVKYLGNK